MFNRLYNRLRGRVRVRDPRYMTDAELEELSKLPYTYSIEPDGMVIDISEVRREWERRMQDDA